MSKIGADNLSISLIYFDFFTNSGIHKGHWSKVAIPKNFLSSSGKFLHQGI